MKGRLPMSFRIAATSNHLSNQMIGHEVQRRVKEGEEAQHAAKRANAASRVSRRNGVTASVMQMKHSVQSPVARVMNSTGLAPSPSVMPNSTMRASGEQRREKHSDLAGTIQRGQFAARRVARARVDARTRSVRTVPRAMIDQSKFFFRSMPS